MNYELIIKLIDCHALLIPITLLINLGRGPSVWDDITHRFPEKVADNSNGDEAANSYEFYKEDVKALVAVGMNFYRFSISWSRVLPDGDISSVNERGLQYYDDLINELIRNKIEPMVTMYHWDMPKRLQG